MEERRKYMRIEAPIVITYKIGKASGAKKSVVKDFSEGGIRFPIYERLKVGTPLGVYIETPFDTIPISAIGRAVWTKALSTREGREIYDVGVKFTKMQTFDKKRMEETTRHFLSMGKKYQAT